MRLNECIFLDEAPKPWPSGSTPPAIPIVINLSDMSSVIAKRSVWGLKAPTGNGINMRSRASAVIAPASTDGDRNHEGQSASHGRD